MAILSYPWHHNTAQHQNSLSWWAPEACCKDFSWIQVEITGSVGILLTNPWAPVLGGA